MLSHGKAPVCNGCPTTCTAVCSVVFTDGPIRIGKRRRPCLGSCAGRIGARAPRMPSIGNCAGRSSGCSFIALGKERSPDPGGTHPDHHTADKINTRFDGGIAWRLQRPIGCSSVALDLAARHMGRHIHRRARKIRNSARGFAALARHLEDLDSRMLLRLPPLAARSDDPTRCWQRWSLAKARVDPLDHHHARLGRQAVRRREA
mmetsp:Transcript_48415/g.112161  ORF Transcript_48415/g.112161 Transcript_48415/m.112161 type:complete len:204 (-) Transcript_48415:139-750(-)